MLKTRNIAAYRDLVVLFTGGVVADDAGADAVSDLRLSRDRDVRYPIAAAAAITLIVLTFMRDRRDEQRAGMKGK
jgi:hypothetical protein